MESNLDETGPVGVADLTAELTARQGRVKKGDVLVVKQGGDKGWIKLLTTSGRLKKYKGNWFNYKKVEPEEAEDDEGSVDLQAKGRWYIFSNNEDDEEMKLRIEQGDSEDVALEGNMILDEAEIGSNPDAEDSETTKQDNELGATKNVVSDSPDTLSWDSLGEKKFMEESPVNVKEDPLNVEDLLDQISKLGVISEESEGSGIEITIGPELITELYDRYHDLQYDRAWADLFLNEDFEYNISAKEESLGDAFNAMSEVLQESRKLYHSVKGFFINLHQLTFSSYAVPSVNQILEALKLADMCGDKIKAKMINVYQRLKTSGIHEVDSLQMFKEDALRCSKVFEIYIEVSIKMSVNIINNAKNALHQAFNPSVKSSAQNMGETSAMNQQVTGSLQGAIQKMPGSSLHKPAKPFLEVDKLFHQNSVRLDSNLGFQNTTEEDETYFRHQGMEYGDYETKFAKSKKGTDRINLPSQDVAMSHAKTIMTQRKMPFRVDKNDLTYHELGSGHPNRDYFKSIQAQPKGQAGVVHGGYLDNADSNSSESHSDDDDSDGPFFRERSHGSQSLALKQQTIPLCNSDLKTLVKLEQAVTEMKERSSKVKLEYVKDDSDIEEMDEGDLLNLSKYGVSAWNIAMEKLDSARYVAGGCLSMLNGKLSSRKEGKIRKAIMDAKLTSKEASKTLRKIKNEVLRRNISTVPVSHEVSKCAVIGKFSGGSMPHIYTWVKDLELALRQLRIPLTLQGNFIRKHLDGEALGRVNLKISRDRINPTKDEVFTILKKYYGRAFTIMKQLGERHKKVKPIPSRQQTRTSGGRHWNIISKSCMEHLKIITAAEDLADEVQDERSTITDENYIEILMSVLPDEAVMLIPALGSTDNRHLFDSIKATIMQIEQVSCQFAIGHSVDEPDDGTSIPGVMVAGANEDSTKKQVICYKCGGSGHLAAVCTSKLGSGEVLALSHKKDNVLCYACGKDGHIATACPNNDGNCYRCGNQHASNQCPSMTSGRVLRTRPGAFPRGTKSALTTCRVCKSFAISSKAEPVTESVHCISPSGWVEQDTCPKIVNLSVAGKVELLDKIRVCKSCLKSITFTSFHPSASCQFLKSKNLQHLMCIDKSCLFRVTTCMDHLHQNRSKLETLKNYYSTRDQTFCFLASCNTWMQEIVTIRNDLKSNLSDMKISKEVLHQPSLFLSMSDCHLPYLCEDPSKLPMLTSKQVFEEKDGTPTFLVFNLQGEGNTKLSVMFDTGASFSLFRTDVMGKSLIASEIHEGRPKRVKGIGGLKEVRNWKCLLPLAEGNSYQAVSAQTVESILSVETVDLRPSLEYIKAIHAPDLETLAVQNLVGSEIAGLIGVKSSVLQPKLVVMTSLGVGLYKIKLKAFGDESQYALGGNIPTFDAIRQELGPNFINLAFTRVTQNLNGFHDMKGSLLITSEELKYQMMAQENAIENNVWEDGSSKQYFSDIMEEDDSDKPANYHERVSLYHDEKTYAVPSLLSTCIKDQRMTHFIGIRISDPIIRENVASFQKELISKGVIVSDHAIPINMLHLTLLAFAIGEHTEEDFFKDFKIAMSDINNENLANLALRFERINRFDDNVIYLEPSETELLCRINTILNLRLRSKYAVDGKFTAHVSIARQKSNMPSMRGLDDLDFGKIYEVGVQGQQYIKAYHMRKPRAQDGFYKEITSQMNAMNDSYHTKHSCDHKCIHGHQFDEEHANFTPTISQASSTVLITSILSELDDIPTNATEGMPGYIYKGLISISDAVEDNYRCIDCLNCKSCTSSMKVEKNSARLEKEMARLRECVRIDHAKKVIICKLPLDEGYEDLLAPNFDSASRRLRTELLKLKRLPPKEQEQVRDSFIKLRKLGYIKKLSELNEDEKKLMNSSEVNYFIPVSIAYKETSISTPARITMDASSKTLSSYSLNNLLPVGSNSFNIAKLVQSWRLKHVGFFTDLSKFYNSFLLEKEFWPLQQMLWDEDLNPESIPTRYYIVTLIYGVSCVASLTEIGLEMLENLHPDELRPMLQHRYIDDIASSYETLDKALEVTEMGLGILQSYGLKSKGSVFTGVKPSEEMASSDGTVQVVGHSWDTMTDDFKLRIPRIILGKKSKSKGKTTFLRIFKGNCIEMLDDFLPANLNLRTMLSLTASVWDVSGQMSPMTGMLWDCVRRACCSGRDYDKFIDVQLRKDFVVRLWEIQQLSNYWYPRSQVNTDTRVENGVLFCFSDAGGKFEQVICYGSFMGSDGSWTCQFLQAKNVLVKMNKTIPNSELNAAATASQMASAILKNNPNIFTRSILCVDSTTVIFWVNDTTSKFNSFRRARTQVIRETFHELYFIRSADNPADTGTRTTVKASDISPTSRFFCGPGYVALGEEKCIRQGILTPSASIMNLQEKSDLKKSWKDWSGQLDPEFVGVMTRSKDKVPQVSANQVPDEITDIMINPQHESLNASSNELNTEKRVPQVSANQTPDAITDIMINPRDDSLSAFTNELNREKKVPLVSANQVPDEITDIMTNPQDESLNASRNDLNTELDEITDTMTEPQDESLKSSISELNQEEGILVEINDIINPQVEDLNVHSSESNTYKKVSELASQIIEDYKVSEVEEVIQTNSVGDDGSERRSRIQDLETFSEELGPIENIRVSKDHINDLTGAEFCLKQEILSAPDCQNYLVCPMRHGLPQSVRAIALSLKFILKTTAGLASKKDFNGNLMQKLNKLRGRIASLAKSNTFPSVFINESFSGTEKTTYYYDCTLGTKQTVLTYPGVTMIRKNLDHTTKVFSSKQHDWTRPLTEHSSKELVAVAEMLTGVINFKRSLECVIRQGGARKRVMDVLAFLYKSVEAIMEECSKFNTYSEVSAQIAQIMSGAVSIGRREHRSEVHTISFISLMESIEEAKYYLNAATSMLVKTAQLHVTTKWSPSKQAMHGIWKEGVLISRHRWRDATAAMEDLGSEGMGMDSLSGFQINVNAPVLPRTSALYLSLACHIHTRVAGMQAINTGKCFTHRSARMDYLISLHFAYAPGGSLVFQKIKDACISCHMKNKKATTVRFGGIAKELLSFATPFSVCAVDLVGPFLVKQMPHSRSTRGNSGNTKAHIVVFTCRITHLTWGEVCETRKTPDICSAFSRFASIWGAPTHVTTDSEGALQKLLREGTFHYSTEDKLFKQLGIKVTTVPVSHHQRNPAEPRCKSMQRLIKGVNLDKHNITIFGLQEIVYLAATLTNSTPFGIILRNATGASPKVLSPLSFISRGVNRERKVLHGPISVPTSLAKYFAHMDEHYKQMLTLYHSVIIPSLLPPEKFIMNEAKTKRLCEGDIVYFNKRPQQKISPRWSLGRVKEAIQSSDDEVRVVKLEYFGAGVTDDSQESINKDNDDEEELSPLLEWNDSTVKKHETTRDAREVVKIPVIDNDLVDHFQSLSDNFLSSNSPAEVLVSNSNNDDDLTLTEITTSLIQEPMSNSSAHLITDACLLETGLTVRDHIMSNKSE